MRCTANATFCCPLACPRHRPCPRKQPELAIGFLKPANTAAKPVLVAPGLPLHCNVVSSVATVPLTYFHTTRNFLRTALTRLATQQFPLVEDCPELERVVWPHHSHILNLILDIDYTWPTSGIRLHTSRSHRYASPIAVSSPVLLECVVAPNHIGSCDGVVTRPHNSASHGSPSVQKSSSTCVCSSSKTTNPPHPAICALRSPPDPSVYTCREVGKGCFVLVARSSHPDASGTGCSHTQF